MIPDRDKPKVREKLSRMDKPVTLVYFTQENECLYCRETRELLEDLVELSEHIKLEVYDFVADAEKAREYGVTKIPAMVLLGDKDHGIRYFGVPAGYEFAGLLEDLVMVSNRDSGLSKTSRARLKALTQPLHVQVFVTPTCPYCPGVVRLAHQFAMESDHVTGDMVEATEFPELSNRYAVMGVPKTVVNEIPAVEGMVGEDDFLEAVLSASE
jgi:glutaredoxin-like protein